MDEDQEIQDEFLLLQILTRESAVTLQRIISNLQFYMSVQIAMGGQFGLIAATIPEELNKTIERAVVTSVLSDY